MDSESAVSLTVAVARAGSTGRCSKPDSEATVTASGNGPSPRPPGDRDSESGPQTQPEALRRNCTANASGRLTSGTASGTAKPQARSCKYMLAQSAELADWDSVAANSETEPVSGSHRVSQSNCVSLSLSRGTYEPDSVAMCRACASARSRTTQRLPHEVAVRPRRSH